MVEVRPTWGFLGGAAEFIAAGEMEIDDEQTQQKKQIQWSNHIALQVGRRRTKLRKAEVVALVELMKQKDFREYVEQCP